mmetsp:Transcript_16914/g.21969  ORF Transcript_16914/g.21969 Transcript_16914/m.21969 type:complete len:356 (-) Transcript_16914:333-1400(-)
MPLFKAHILFQLLALYPIVVTAFQISPHTVGISHHDLASSKVGIGLRASNAEVFETENNILLLEHVNINHEAGRHDLVKAFYFDILGCAVDARRAQNLELGRKTLWANIGINQFHLPEAEVAQVIPGKVVLTYPDLQSVKSKLNQASDVLKGTKFDWSENDDGTIAVSCPWGNKMELIHDGGVGKDPRGKQEDNKESEGTALKEVHIYVQHNANLAGIMRFYEKVLGAKVNLEKDSVEVEMGPYHSLVFSKQPQGTVIPEYDGHHVAIYVADLAKSFENADAKGLVFINPRFKDKADTLEKALEIHQFRLLNIVDPEDSEGKTILQLEHEVRSADRPSCPFTRTESEQIAKAISN